MNIDNEKTFHENARIVYYQYRAFLKTIESYKDDSVLVSKLSSQFVNGKYDGSETRGIHQVVLLAISTLNCKLSIYGKSAIARNFSSIDYYIKYIGIKNNKEFELAIQPFKLLFKYCNKKGIKTNDINYTLQSEWFNN